MRIKDILDSATTVQQLSVREYESHDKYSKIIELAEAALDIFESFLKTPHRRDDIMAIAFHDMVFRAHRSIQAAILLSLGGLEIPALSLTRDLLEIEYLLRYFIECPTEVKIWWRGDRRLRQSRFGPGILRGKLAKDQQMKTNMDDDYFGHSEVAAHPSPLSLELQKGSYGVGGLRISRNPVIIWYSMMDVSFHAAKIAHFIGIGGDLIAPKAGFGNKLERLANLYNEAMKDKKIASMLLHFRLKYVQDKIKPK